MTENMEGYGFSGIKPNVNRYFHVLLFLLLLNGCADPQTITEDAAIGAIPMGAAKVKKDRQ